VYAKPTPIVWRVNQTRSVIKLVNLVWEARVKTWRVVNAAFGVIIFLEIHARLHAFGLSREALQRFPAINQSIAIKACVAGA
jgi:hypothetical protein